MGMHPDESYQRHEVIYQELLRILNKLEHIEEQVVGKIDLLIDKVNRIEDWIDERTPPDSPKPEGVFYCYMVKKHIGHERGCLCTTETGCTFLSTQNSISRREG